MYGVLTDRGVSTPDARKRSVTSLRNCAVRSAPCCLSAISSSDSSDAEDLLVVAVVLQRRAVAGSACARLRLGFLTLFHAIYDLRLIVYD